MQDPKSAQRGRAQFPAEYIDPCPTGEIRDHIQEPFRPSWEELEAIATACPNLALRSVGAYVSGGFPYNIPRARFTGPKSGGDPIRLAVFAGLGGNDALTRKVVVRFLRRLSERPDLAMGIELSAYPVPDPEGGAADRADSNGAEFARDFWSGSTRAPVYFLERELGVFRFHGIVVLGSVPRSGRLGLHLDSSVLRTAMLNPLQEAADRWLPPNEGSGGRCVGDAAACLADSPEIRSRAFGVTLCLPALEDPESVTLGAVAVLEELMGRYRGFLALGQNI